MTNKRIYSKIQEYKKQNLINIYEIFLHQLKSVF